ncbi:hypothetical protein LZ32DRAFT_402268 [Colletotrichum eremochloae]|nr:hypothetical protein LZ32DRAFT_402268 [Colletotrichum eremochloae]
MTGWCRFASRPLICREGRWFSARPVLGSRGNHLLTPLPIVIKGGNGIVLGPDFLRCRDDSRSRCRWRTRELCDLVGFFLWLGNLLRCQYVRPFRLTAGIGGRPLHGREMDSGCYSLVLTLQLEAKGFNALCLHTANFPPV